MACNKRVWAEVVFVAVVCNPTLAVHRGNGDLRCFRLSDDVRVICKGPVSGGSTCQYVLYTYVYLVLGSLRDVHQSIQNGITIQPVISITIMGWHDHINSKFVNPPATASCWFPIPFYPLYFFWKVRDSKG